MNVIVFEDKYINDLNPISINHASFEIKCGILTNLERIVNNFDSNEIKFILIVRDNLKELVQEKFPRFTVNPNVIPNGLFVNGAALWNKEKLKKIQEGHAFSNLGRLLSFKSNKQIDQENFHEYLQDISKVTSDLDVEIITYQWELIDKIEKYINLDINELSKSSEFVKHYTGTQNLNQSIIKIGSNENIFLHENSMVEPGTILDSRNGPIILNHGALVESGSIIKGPVFVDNNSIINNATKLKSNVIIGPNCKVGGEISNSIFNGFSNKQHDGFLGHSIIGEWVNLGANTNTSNLKNNYSKIKFNFSDKIVETNKQFLGVIIGDYSRSAIGTLFNTGTYVGLGANIFSNNFSKKYIKSFSWGDSEVVDFSKFIQTIKLMKQRRNKKITEVEIKFLQKLYENSSKIS